MSSEVSPCKYSPDRGVDYYARELARILRDKVGGESSKSTHAYVKEVRDALQTLVLTVWDKYEEYIPVIVEANVPDELYESEKRDCFSDLLTGLLKSFRESANDLPIGARIRLMNMTIAAIAEMARRKDFSVGEQKNSSIFSRQDPELGPVSQSGKGGESR